MQKLFQQLQARLTLQIQQQLQPQQIQQQPEMLPYRQLTPEPDQH
jgi:hypothetical protein